MESLPAALAGLVASDSPEDLVERLTVAAGLACGLPGVLYLYDGDADAYYPAAGLGGDTPAGDLPRGSAAGLALTWQDQPLGLLQLAQTADPAASALLAAVLPPVLLNVRLVNGLAGDLRASDELVAQLVVAGGLLRHLQPDVLLTKILETYLGAVKAQVGALLVAEANGPLKAQVSWGLREADLRLLRLRDGTEVGDYVRATGRSRLWAAEDLARDLDLGPMAGRLTGLLGFPLIGRDRTLGVILLANPEQDFGPRQQRLGETLCNIAAIALENAFLVQAMVDRERLQQELAIARSVQNHMFPVRGLVCQGLRVEGRSRPCSETGGDYFTFHADDRNLLVMIGDVSGHGLGAALFTTMAHALVQQQLRAGTTPKEALLAVNDGLFHTQSGRFMTAALVMVEAATRRFSYVSAGHTPLLLVSRDGEPRWLESTGMPLGILATIPLQEPDAIQARPGDVLLLYTDGYTEAVNPQGEAYGDDRLAACVAGGVVAGLDLDGLLHVIETDLDAWTVGEVQRDDLTLVAIAF